MKSQNLLLGICLAALIVSEIFLISANRQKSEAIAQWHQAQEQVADLQSQLAQATNSVDSDSELARARADNQDIPRLRNQIRQLQTQNTNLWQQLSATRQAGQVVQQQLQDLEDQSEQAAADQQAQAQVVERITAQHRNQCIANLRLIYAAKQAWALEKNKNDTDTPSEQDLLPYIKGGSFPVCPSGGTYTIGPVGQLPTCSVPDHVLPPQ